MIHLATCSDCDAQMDVTDLGPFTLVKCPDCEREVRVKTEVGPYRLVRRLAIGGMSVVFVAWDETLGREIVVKLLSEEYSGVEKRGRQFEKEAEMTAAVSHPNVVRVYTVGQAFDRFYIAMEFVDGESLEEWMKRAGALPESEVLPMALQVVDGLEAAQRAGLVHRDVKPGNILLDGKKTAKIVDFGLSLLTEGGTVTAAEIWATPYYVPPEALEHENEDFRSDIYALGATLYHALAGRPPIKTKELATAKLREEKRRVPSLRTVAPWLKPQTVRAVETAMAVSRENRFSSYGEFRRALEDALDAAGEKTPIHSEARVLRRQRESVHKKAWAIALIGSLMLLAVVAAYLWVEAGKERGNGEAERGIDDGSVEVIDRAAILDPLVALEISELYDAARGALAEENFVRAEAQFLAVWNHAGSPPRTAAWAVFEAAVAAYVDGRSGDGREYLQGLNDFLTENKEEKTTLGKTLRIGTSMLLRLEFGSEEHLAKVLDDPFRATVYFAVAVKMWEQGQMERATRMFEKFRSAGPWNGAEWVEIYQELAGDYVWDMERLQGVDHATRGKTAEELQEATVSLEAIYVTLRTRGRARFNIKVWQTEMVRRMRELQAMHKKPIDERWREAVQAVWVLFRAGSFTRASEQLKAVAISGERERAQRDDLVWLSDSAGAFLQEMESRLVLGDTEKEMLTRDGVAFQGVIESGPNGLMVKDGDETRWLGWDEIEPTSLLGVIRWEAVGEDSRLSRARLLEISAAYAALNGKLNEAEQIAAVLAAEDEHFAERWTGMKRRYGR